MFKIGICGHFGNSNSVDGQTIKTKNLYEGFVDKLGSKQVTTVNTCGWKRNPFKLLLNCIKLVSHSENIIILPAQNGVKVFLPLYFIINLCFKKKIHYFVVGGWLPDLLMENRYLMKYLKRFDNILVETNVLKSRLSEMGLTNITMVPNFKDLTIIQESEMKEVPSNYYKLCLLSRIIPQKGVEDAISIIEKINSSKLGIKCSLDLYGPISPEYASDFQSLLKNVSSAIKYRGIVDYKETVNILKNYDVFLFPTKFKTEGIPGSIIDAYAAGLPVIASNWESASEIIVEGETGLIYEFDNINDFEAVLIRLLSNPELLKGIRLNCLNKAEEYTSSKVIEQLLTHIIK